MTDTSSSVPVPAAPPRAPGITLASNAAAGGTAVMLGETINWALACYQQHALVNPDNTVILAWGAALSVILHAAVKAASTLWGALLSRYHLTGA